MIQNKIDYISKEEQEILINNIHKTKDRLIILLLLDCGLRVSECISLRLHCFDFKKRLVNVVSLKKKVKTIRTIPLSNRLYQTLSDYLEEEKLALLPDTWIFPAKGGILPHLTRSACWKMLRKYSKITGLSNLHPHTLRHSFATSHLANGTQLEDIKTMLGHSSYDTTLIYAKIPLERLTERVNAVTSNPPTIWQRFFRKIVPQKSAKLININFTNNHFTIGRNKELALINDHLLKGINTIILGGIGVGKSHLIEQIETEKKILRFDDSESIKQSLVQLILYLFKGDKKAALELVWKDFSIDQVKNQIQRENNIQLCNTIISIVKPKEYILLIDDITRITPSGRKVLERLKDTFIIVTCAREIKANDTSFLWNFEEVRLENLNRSDSLKLIKQLSGGLEIENYNLFLNHVYEQTNGNPRALNEIIERYRKEPFITNETIRDIRHTGALTEIDMTFTIVIFLGIITALRYASSELEEPALRLVGSIGLILLIVSRPFFAHLKRRFI